MALDPKSYLPEFFTEERLTRYRKLHSDYPLWCGVWPESENRLPEAQRWSKSELLSPLEAKIRGNFFALAFEERTREDLIPPPSIYWGEVLPPEAIDTSPEDPDASHYRLRCTYRLQPLSASALLAAINYVFAESYSPDFRNRGAPTYPHEDWLLRIEDSLRTDQNRPTRIAWELVRARSEVLHADDKRERAIEALESVWVKLGRLAGVIPLTRGGLRCFLSDEFLGQLLIQAQGLVEEVRHWEPSEEGLAWIRSSIGLTETSLPQEISFLIEEMEDQGLVDRAAEIRKRHRQTQGRAVDEAEEVIPWLRLLDFPMLTETEILAVVNSPCPRSTLEPAAELVGSRIGITASTIKNRTHPRR